MKMADQHGSDFLTFYKTWCYNSVITNDQAPQIESVTCNAIPVTVYDFPFGALSSF